MIIKPLPSQAEIRAALNYDPDTGEWRWRERADISLRANRRFAGRRAGKASVWGLVIRLNGQGYYASRLAWVYMHGDVLDTETRIDHKNCDNSDGRFDNLRLATAGENSANTRGWLKRIGLPKGVVLHRKSYQATICVRGKHSYLGKFKTAEEAHRAYVAAAIAAWGEFARAGA